MAIKRSKLNIANKKNLIDHIYINVLALLLSSCNDPATIEGKLKREACAIARKVVAQKVPVKNIRFGSCSPKDVIFSDNGSYEVNSLIEVAEPSGKLLRYAYFVIMTYKGGNADHHQNWQIKKLHVEVFWNTAKKLR